MGDSQFYLANLYFSIEQKNKAQSKYLAEIVHLELIPNRLFFIHPNGRLETSAISLTQAGAMELLKLLGLLDSV